MEKNWRNKFATLGFSGMALGAGIGFVVSLGQDTWQAYLYLFSAVSFALATRVVMQGGDPSRGLAQIPYLVGILFYSFTFPFQKPYWGLVILMWVCITLSVLIAIITEIYDSKSKPAP